MFQKHFLLCKGQDVTGPVNTYSVKFSNFSELYFGKCLVVLHYKKRILEIF